jgi:predicted MPP superfamily phosphohydrolase
VRVLRNEIADVGGLQIVGTDDLWAGRFDPEEALGSLRPEKAALVLTHNPDAADRDGWGTYEGWILCGHTHGGQCKPPLLSPPLVPVKNRRYTAGEFRLAGNRRMYINRGVGYLLQARFNARPEVTVFQLTRA